MARSSRDPNYDLVWNGTMERTGDHPGLSRMTGPSSALLCMRLPEAEDAQEESTGAPRGRHVAPPAPSKLRAIARMLASGAPHAEIRRTLGVSQWFISEVVRARPGLQRKMHRNKR